MESASSGEERPSLFRLSSFKKDPFDLVQVEYKTHEGKKKKSKLLTSGFWGLARHLNYVFELLLALSWRDLLIFSCPKLILFSAFPHLAMASFPLPTSGSS